MFAIQWRGTQVENSILQSSSVRICNAEMTWSDITCWSSGSSECRYRTFSSSSITIGNGCSDNWRQYIWTSGRQGAAEVLFWNKHRGKTVCKITFVYRLMNNIFQVTIPLLLLLFRGINKAKSEKMATSISTFFPATNICEPFFSIVCVGFPDNCRCICPMSFEQQL